MRSRYVEIRETELESIVTLLCDPHKCENLNHQQINVEYLSSGRHKILETF